MGLALGLGAVSQCPFGVAPTPLVFLPTSMLFGASGPLGSVIDFVPFLNVIPFGVCSSLANPVTAALTTAALGVLTPGPCIPVPTGPWLPAKPTVLSSIAGPLTNDSAKLICAYGGVIQVNMPAQFTVMV